MELLAEIFGSDFGAEAPKKVKYRLRKAARAVLMDKMGRIALFYSNKYDYYNCLGEE